MKMMARVVLVSIAAIAVAAFVQPGSAFAESPPTQVIAVMAFGPAGQARNGYLVLSGPVSVGVAIYCSVLSPASVADFVY
jgi:hypothetical protein